MTVGMTESFVSFESFYLQLKDLPVEMKVRLYDAINEYGLYGNEVELSVIEKAIFLPIKMVIDHAKANRKIRQQNGANGGRPKTKTENNQTKPKETKAKPNQKLNVNGNGNVNVNNTHTTEFIQEVLENKSEPVDNSEENGTEVPGVCADDLTDTVTSVIEKHNESVPNAQKITCTKNKVKRLLSSLPSGQSPGQITTALNNYLSVTRMDTWKTTFSLSNFAKEYLDFTSDYFAASKYSRVKTEVPHLVQEKPPDKKLVSWYVCSNCGDVHPIDEYCCPNCGSNSRAIARGEVYPSGFDKAG